MTAQPGLFARRPRFDGATFDPAFDQDRLEKQIGRVWDAMKDGRYRTLEQIHAITGDSTASISAQLRNLRKARFGGYEVQKQHRGDRSLGLYEYRVVVPQ